MRLKLWLLLLCVLAALPLSAQKTTGTIQGVVTDQTGAIVPGAKVNIVNTATNDSRVVTSNSAGEYIANDLSPAVYELRVQAQNFRESIIKNVELHVASSDRGSCGRGTVVPRACATSGSGAAADPRCTIWCTEHPARQTKCTARV